MLALGFVERRRTFAILNAIGAKPRQLAAFLWSEGLLIVRRWIRLRPAVGLPDGVDACETVDRRVRPATRSVCRSPGLYLGLVLCLVAASVVAAVLSAMPTSGARRRAPSGFLTVRIGLRICKVAAILPKTLPRRFEPSSLKVREMIRSVSRTAPGRHRCRSGQQPFGIAMRPKRENENEEISHRNRNDIGSRILDRRLRQRRPPARSQASTRKATRSRCRTARPSRCRKGSKPRPSRSAKRWSSPIPRRPASWRLRASTRPSELCPAPALGHDPEKWNPAFEQSHGQQER